MRKRFPLRSSSPLKCRCPPRVSFSCCTHHSLTHRHRAHDDSSGRCCTHQTRKFVTKGMKLVRIIQVWKFTLTRVGMAHSCGQSHLGHLRESRICLVHSTGQRGGLVWQAVSHCLSSRKTPFTSQGPRMKVVL